MHGRIKLQHVVDILIWPFQASHAKKLTFCQITISARKMRLAGGIEDVTSKLPGSPLGREVGLIADGARPSLQIRI